MKKTMMFLMTIIFCAGIASAQDQKQEMTKEQKAWMEYMTPSDGHKMLGESTGEWNVKTTFWMYAGAEPTVEEGKANYELILGGRYLLMKQTGVSMGMPFEGMGIMGYDNAKQEYFSTWVDNMSTGIAMSKGKYNEETNSIEMTGSMYDPMTKKDVDYRIVSSFIDENSHKMEMYSKTPDGTEYKSFVMEYTR